MGRSLDVHLVYGYHWAEDEDGYGYENFRLFDEEMEWDEAVVLHRGEVPNPWDSVPEEINSGPMGVYEAWRAQPENAALFDAWAAARKAVREEFPNIDTRYAGVTDFTEELLVIKDAYPSSWGWVQKIDAELLALPGKHSWDVELERFAEAAGVDLSKAVGPSWFVIGNYT